MRVDELVLDVIDRKFSTTQQDGSDFSSYYGRLKTESVLYSPLREGEYKAKPTKHGIPLIPSIDVFDVERVGSCSMMPHDSACSTASYITRCGTCTCT